MRAQTSRLIAVASLAIACLIPVAGADDFAWAEPDDGDFGDAANWNDGTDGVPGAGDVANFGVFGVYTVNIMTSRTNDRLVARRGDVRLELAGEDVVYELLGGSEAAPGVVIGDAPRDVAGITVSGGTLRADRISIARLPASSGSLGTAVGEEEQGLDVGVLVVGEGGTGLLSTGTFTADRVEIGLGVSGFGDATLTAGTCDVTEEMVIGGAGIGVMTVEAGTMLSAASAVVGRDAGASGRLAVSGIVQLDGDLEIGRDGRGVLDVKQSALVDVGGDLTARLATPADPPIVVRIPSSLATGPAIAVAGVAAIEALAIETTFVPALDSEFLLVTASSGLMDTAVIDSELPLGLAWEIVQSDTELLARVVTDPCPPGPGEDCNGNGVRDECDIVFGTSLDCNANDVPDECDVAYGVYPDCNANLVPDSCDIADGASEDCDADGIPDDCTPADVRTLLDALGSPGDAFGEAADVYDDLAVVGSPEASPPYVTVFVQRGTRWVRDARLFASDGALGDGFGRSVGAGDGIVVVGAGAGEAGGAVYVFARDATGTWSEVVRLGPPFDTVEGFGTSVDATDGFVIVGARQNVGALVRGVGYIFAESREWALEGTVLAGLTATAVRPGAGVAITGESAAIAWPGEGVTAPGAFGFSERIPSAGTWFTRPVASPPGIVAGADVGVSENGLAGRLESEELRGVVVYRRESPFFFEVDTLIAQPDGDTFGVAIDASEGRLAVGASGDGAGGRVYTYRQAGGTTWQLDEILEPGASDGGRFGAAVGLDVGRLVAGAPDDNAQGESAGAAWIADLPGPDCNGNGVIDRCDILDGTSADEDGDGVPDECADTCPWDLDGSGGVGFADLAELLGSWGPCPNCRADVNGDGAVGFDELADLLGTWGPCP